MVREVALVVRLSEDERASWHGAARAAGWGKTAGWVRSVVAAAVAGGGASSTTSAPSLRSPKSSTVDREVLGELARIGSNVNQIARAVNAAAQAGQPLEVQAVAVQALQLEVARLSTLVKASSVGSRA